VHVCVLSLHVLLTAAKDNGTHLDMKLYRSRSIEILKKKKRITEICQPDFQCRELLTSLFL